MNDPKATSLILLFILLLFCKLISAQHLDNTPLDKVKFDINKLDENGLYGPPDGLRLLDYAFCIPNDIEKAQEIRKINPEIVIFQSKNEFIDRAISCKAEESFFCLANTAQTNFKEVILTTAAFPYVSDIIEFHYR